MSASLPHVAGRPTDAATSAGGTTVGGVAGSHGGHGQGPVWPTVGDAVDSLFSVFDTNSDGSIALAEIQGVLDPQGHHPALNAVVRNLVEQIDTDGDSSLSSDEVTEALTALDTNGDGSLSPTDLGAAVARLGTAPLLAGLLQGFPLPGGGADPGPNPPGPVGPPQAPTVEQVVDVLVTRFDADDDGALTLAELLAVLDPASRHGKLAAAMQELVAAVDTSGDGTMSEAELTAAVATLDADGNGTLDHRDHVPGPPTDDSVDLIGLLMPHMRDFDVTTLGHFG